MLAVPVMMGNLSQMLIGVTDTIMIGQLGVGPLATATFANNLVSIFFVCGIGFFTAVSVRTSQLRGAQVMRLIPNSLFHGMILALIAGFLMSLVIWGLVPWLYLFGQPEEVVHAVPSYLILLGFSMIPAMLTLVFKNFGEAFERPWVPLGITMFGALLNVLLNYLLIYGKFGFPRMELEGAGWATLIARGVTLLLFVIWLANNRFFRNYLPSREQWKLTLSEISVYIRLGIPPSLHLLAEVSAFAGSAFMMGWLGEVEMAAHQIALVTIGTIFMVPLGLAMSGTIRIGKAYGAESWQRLRPLGLSVMIPGLLFTLVCALFLWFGGERVAGWFIEEQGVRSMTASLFLVASLFLMADGLQVIAVGCLRGLSDVRVPMIYGIISYVGIALPLSYLLAFKWELGAMGIWSGLAITITLMAAAVTIRFFLKVRRNVSRTVAI